jgi:hypothetical protein
MRWTCTFPLAVVTLVGCSVDLSVSDEAQITCAKKDDCPDDMECLGNGRCAPRGTADDTTHPGVLAATPLDAEHVVVDFTEAVDEDSAVDPENYQISPALAVVAVVGFDEQSVTLEVEVQTPDQAYTLTVSGVLDLAGWPLDEDAASADFTGHGVAADPNPPRHLAPAHGELIVDPAGQVFFEWAAATGAPVGYDLEIYDAPDSLTPLVQERITTLRYPEGSGSYTLPTSTSYWWRVRAVFAHADGPFGLLSRFALLDDRVHVYCAQGSPCTGGEEDGTANQPYEAVRRALGNPVAVGSAPWTLAIAARGGGLAYDGSLDLPGNVSLQGGYDPTFAEAARSSDPTATIIRGDSASAASIDCVRDDRPIRIERLTLIGASGGTSMGLHAVDCGSELELTDSHFVGGATEGRSYGLYFAGDDSDAPGPVLTRVEARGGSSGSTPVTWNSYGLYVSYTSVTATDSVFTVGATQGGFTFGVYAYSSRLVLTDSQILGGDVPFTTSTGIHVDEYSELLADRCLIRGGDGVNQSRGIQAMELSTITVTNSVILSGTATNFTYAVDGGWLGSVISNSVVVAGSAPTTVGIQLGSGRILSVANTIVATRSATGICIRELTAGANLEALHNSVLTGCATLYRDSGATNYTTESQLTAANINSGAPAGSVGGNLGPPTIPDVAAVGFASFAGNDFHLTGSTPASITDGGRNTATSICGTNSNGTCGAVTTDGDGAPRTVPYSIGAYER